MQSNASVFRVLLIFLVILGVSSVFGQVILDNATWKINPDSFSWLPSTKSVVRGGDYNPATDHVLLVSRAGGLQVVVLDAATGDSINTLDVTGVSGGTFSLNEIAITRDGQIFGANLVLDASSSNVKIYRWADENSVPEVVFDGTVDAKRYGDAVGVEGTGTDVYFYLSGSGNDQVAKFAYNGTTLDTPTILGLAENSLARGGIAGIPGEDSLWVNGFGNETSKISSLDGSIGSRISGSILSSTHMDVDFWDFNGKKLVAVGPGNAEEFRVVDVSDIHAPSVKAVTESMGSNSNGNKTGMVAFDTKRNNLIVMSTNNAIASYSIEPLLGTDFEAVLSGLNVIQPANSTGSGNVTVTLSQSGDSIFVQGSFSNLVGDHTASHIHVGFADENGGVVYPLTATVDADNKGGTFEIQNNTFPIGGDTLAQLQGGQLYVNVHTTEYPAGEIRGQILLSPNSPPAAVTNVTPADGDTLVVEGSGATEVAITWDPATDPNGDRVVYLWQLSQSASLDSFIAVDHLGTETMSIVNFAIIDSMLIELGLAMGDTITLYHQVSSSDGSLQTPGDTLALVFIRGLVTQSIADARAADPATVVTVEALVTRAKGSYTWLQDQTGGIAVYAESGPFFDAVANGDVAMGDIIRLTAETADNNFQAELVNVSEFTVISRDNPLPPPIPVTLAELDTNGEAYESQLVEVRYLTIDPAGDGDFQADKTYDISDPTDSSNAVSLKIPATDDTDIDGQPIPDKLVIFEGVVGQSHNSDPEAGYQLVPVLESDIRIQPTLTEVWRIDVNTNNWFRNDYKTRGGDYNPATDHLLVVSRSGGLRIVILDAATGDSLGLLDMTGVSGGLFPLNEIAITRDGQIFGANLVLDASTSNVKVYRWADESSTPEVVFDGTIDAKRYGDAVGVSGTGTDVYFYLSGSTNDQVAKFAYNGTKLDAPSLLVHGVSGLARGGIAEIQGEDSLWVNGYGTPASKIGNVDGAVGTQLPEEEVPHSTMDLDFFDFQGIKLLTVGPDDGEVFYVVDVSDAANPRSLVKTDSLGSNTNLNKTGFVTYDTRRYNLIVMSSNNAIVSYHMDFLPDSPVAIEDPVSDKLPVSFRLLGNYPNPFNPITNIRFDLPERAAVKVDIFDILGRKVMTLNEGVLIPGAAREVRVDASALASGIYFYRVTAATPKQKFMDIGKMVLIK